MKMKSLADLEAIRQRTLDKVNLRREHEGTRISVGMATCGIAAGARPVLLAFMDEINKRGLLDVTVAQTGCIGMCRLEPIVEISVPGKEKVTYVKVNPTWCRASSPSMWSTATPSPSIPSARRTSNRPFARPPLSREKGRD